MEKERIKIFLKHNWSIDAERIIQLPQSTARCWKIETKNRIYFMKIFQNSFHESRAVSEYDVCRTLRERGVPVSNIILTNYDQPYILYGTRIVQLQDFEEGTTPNPNSMSKMMLCEAAEYLGKIHSILKEKELPMLFDRKWLDKFSETTNISFYLETLNLVEKSDISEIQKKKIQNDLVFLIEFTKEMNFLSSYFDHATYTASHGDFLHSQLICNDDRILKIIDFANVHKVPVVLELMRFYWMGSSDCQTPNLFDIYIFTEYLLSYMKYNHLSKKDIKSMPYIYLYYMGRNRFAYRDYLQTGDSRSFYESSWRVDVIRYLYQNADNISVKLACFLGNFGCVE